MPKVSIILSTYNHGSFVGKAIQSILEQTFKDFELIVIDDASKDGTVKVLKLINDPRVKVFYNTKNLGVNVNRNKYIQMSTGEYIAIMNADDEWLPSKLEKQVKFLDVNPGIGAVFTQARIIDNNGNDFDDKEHKYYQAFKEPNRTRYEWLNLMFFAGNNLCHPSVLMRKKCHEDIGYYDLRLGQMVDYDLWIRLCLQYEIHVLPDELVRFRILSDESNISGNRPDANKRVRWVGTQILKHYLQIRTASEFLKIFPEAAKDKDIIEDDTIRFFLAKLALTTKKERLIFFAVNTIFDLLADPLIEKKLSEKCGFTYNDFVKMTGTYDLFNIEKVRSLNEELNKKKQKRFGLF
jgi:glycosyltransferase involved in cell wall biosynthesis